MSSPEQVRPPDAVYVRQRWIPIHTVQWVEECDQIMLEYGQVNGATVYRKRHQARYRVRHLKRLMVELRKHEGWQLVEHISRKDNGYVWTLEYLGRKETS